MEVNDEKGTKDCAGSADDCLGNGSGGRRLCWTNANTDTHTNANSNPNANPNPDTYTYTYTHTYTNTHANTYTHANPGTTRLDWFYYL